MYEYYGYEPLPHRIGGVPSRALRTDVLKTRKYRMGGSGAIRVISKWRIISTKSLSRDFLFGVIRAQLNIILLPVD